MSDREEFEEYAIGLHLNIKKPGNDGHEYQSQMTELRWGAWQAATASMQAKVDALEAENARLKADDKGFRNLLAHWHDYSKEHHIYWDDGEMRCNACLIDFNVDGPEVMLGKLVRFNSDKIARDALKGK